MSYEVKPVDLSAVKDTDQIIVPVSKRISEFFILDMPAGAQFKLRVGSSNPLIPVTRPFTMEPTGEDEANNGLFFQNDAAQAGVIVYIVVVYGGAELSPVLT